MSEHNYTLKQIRDAFYAVFHLSGEQWFNYLDTDEENNSCTEAHWQAMADELYKFDNGAINDRT